MLPCLVSAGINVITLFCTYFFLPETLPRIVKKLEKTAKGQTYQKIGGETSDHSKDVEMVILEPFPSNGSDKPHSTTLPKSMSVNGGAESEKRLDLVNENGNSTNDKSSEIIERATEEPKTSTPEDEVDDIPEFKAYMLTFWEALKGREVRSLFLLLYL